MTLMCPAFGRKDLRNYATGIRKKLHLENVLRFPAVEFLESLPALIGDNSLYYDCVNDSAWDVPDVHAYYDLEENCIRIKESVYIGAARHNNGRDRMTVTHECCHVLLLRHSGLTLTRNFTGNVPAYRDPEWQAKCLAGELMVPAPLVRNMSPSDIATECGVSLQAARYQLQCYR